MLRNGGAIGLSRDPGAVCSGGHGGYQMINVLVHAGVRRIVLLGYDCQIQQDGRRHGPGGEHPDHTPSAAAVERNARTFLTLREPLYDAGVEVLNASRSTAITAFPRVSLERALA